MSDEDHFIKWFKQVNAKRADAPNCPDSLREQLRGAVVILKPALDDPDQAPLEVTLSGDISIGKVEDEEETPK